MSRGLPIPIRLPPDDAADCRVEALTLGIRLGTYLRQIIQARPRNVDPGSVPCPTCTGRGRVAGPTKER